MKETSLYFSFRIPVPELLRKYNTAFTRQKSHGNFPSFAAKTSQQFHERNQVAGLKSHDLHHVPEINDLCHVALETRAYCTESAIGSK